MDKIKRMSRRFRWFFLMVFAALPLVNALAWGNAGTLAAMGVLNLLGVEGPMLRAVSEVGTGAMVLGFAASMLGGGFVMAAMWYLARLFGEFSRGELFTAGNVRLVSRTGWMFLLAEAASPFQQALASIALTLGNPVGERVISLGISDADIGGVVLGLGMIFAAKVLEEARMLQENDALTI